MEEAPPVRARFGVVALLAACNQVYGLTTPTALDADFTIPDALDADHDGVADEVDNCPGVPNSNQSDIDHDHHGDACDNCPLLVNDNQADFDQDGVGDVCDAHISSGMDCLILVDTFGDPAAFTSHWTTLSFPPDTPMPSPSPGMVHVEAGSSQTMAIVALDDHGDALDGAFDVEVLGRAQPTIPYSGIYAATRLTSIATTRGYMCGAIVEPGNVSFQQLAVWAGPSSSDTQDYDMVPPMQVGTDLLMKFDASDAPTVTCRIDLGLSVGAAIKTEPLTPPNTGGPGVIAAQASVDVIGFAAYRPSTGPCPAPIVR